MEPELIADVRCDLGENPLWHTIEQRLYWTDILGGKIYRFDPRTGHHEECYRGSPVGGFTIQADGALLLFMERGAIAVWREGHLNYLVHEIPAELDNRFNDVIADPIGRVYCGTLSTPFEKREGQLYRLDPDGSLHVILEGIGVSNGMGFTLDRKHMYYTDSFLRNIYIFDYHEETGALTNQRVWVQSPEGAGVPDGMTVDACGHIWSARWGDSAIFRYTSSGVEERRIEFPAKFVSSVAFGGDDLSDLYVTTALLGGTKDDNGVGAGALFRFRPGVRGVPEFCSRIKV